MNIAQEPFTAPFFPPCSIEDSQNPSKDSAKNFNPSRCEFTFSDGRQCRNSAKVYPRDELSPVKKVPMQRASLCPHHASKLERNPGDKVAPALEAPELQALCGDLTTATNINRALAQVFLLMAQGLIAQKQAVAFGYLSQLLLQTVPGIRSEYVAAFGYQPWEEKLKASLAANAAPSQKGDPLMAKGCQFSPESHGHREQTTPPEPLPLGNSPSNSAPATSLHEPVSSPDYASLLSRSHNLFDGKYDATPEGRREANALATELELMKPPSSKPPKGTRASVIEHMKRWIARGKAPASGAAANASPHSTAPTIVFDPPARPPRIPQPQAPTLAAPSSELPAPCRPEIPARVSQASVELAAPNKLSPPPPRPAPAAPETKPREDHFVAPPSRRHAEPEVPFTRVDHPTSPPRKGYQQDAFFAGNKVVPGDEPERWISPSPPPNRWVSPVPPVPEISPATLGHRVDWYAPASWSKTRTPDPFPSRAEKAARKLRGMSNYRLRHLQHLNSKGF